MAATAVTELPPGFTLDELPQGFKLDEPGIPTPPNAGPRQPSQTAMGWVGNRIAEGPKPIGEAGLAIGSGAVGASLGGLAGLAGAALPGPEGQGRDWAQAVHGAVQYHPKSESGQSVARLIGLPGEALAYLGGKLGRGAQDAGASPAVATGVDVGVQALPMILGYGWGKARGPKMDPAEQMFDVSKPAPKMPASSASKLAKAKDSGFRFTPSEGGGGPISKTLESIAGEERLGKAISRKNQPLVNQKIGSDVGIEPGGIRDFGALNATKETAWSGYDAVKRTGVMESDPVFYKAIDNLADPYLKLGEQLPVLARKSMVDTLKGLKQPTISASVAVEAIKDLRGRAKQAFAEKNGMQGQTFVDAARAFEDLIGRHIVRTGQSPTLVDGYRNSRTTIAKVYEAKQALNPATGDFNPQHYARLYKKGSPLSGGAADVGEAASLGKRSFRPAEQIGSTGFSLQDLWTILAGKAGDMGLSAITLGARPAIRALLASRLGQGMIGADISNPAINALKYGGVAGMTNEESK